MQSSTLSRVEGVWVWVVGLGMEVKVLGMEKCGTWSGRQQG